MHNVSSRRIKSGMAAVLMALALAACDSAEQQDKQERASTPIPQHTQAPVLKDMHNTINYVEFPMTGPMATKAFYGAAFGWRFTDWGPDYISFASRGINGGFALVNEPITPQSTPLIVLYVDNLEVSLEAVTQAGGQIIRPIYAFPGGRRFHFRDPNGNELAVWSR